MAKLGISTGTTPNDGTGDNLLAGAVKINSNFNEIYTRFGDGTNLTSIGGTWTLTSVGIHTLKNVGIGTTNPRFALEVGAVGASGTTLFVNGDARVTGIVTIGPASITLNGITNIINVGTGITINGSTGIISATAIVIGGTTLTGAGVTFITAGSGISVNQGTGNVTITATGTGSTSQWVTTAAGIHTLSNVGIGTTNPTSALTVTGNGTFTGVVTATTFIGALTGTATTATNAQGLTGTPNITVGVATASTLNVGTGGTVITTTTAGLVGIGTTNPTSKLTVGAVGSATTNLVVNGFAKIDQIVIKNNSINYQDNIIMTQHPAVTFTGNRNVAIGDYSFTTPGAAGENVAIGYYALNVLGNNDIYSIYSGNTALGCFSGQSSTYTLRNTLIGYKSGQFITIGDTNTILGAFDGNQNGLDIRTSDGNVVLSDGDGNIRFYANSSGNVGLGTTNPTNKLTVSGDALINGLTVGLGSGAVTSNTAIGSSALYSNTTGYQNTANGGRALYFNTTGDGNTSTGYQALYYNTTGDFNTANGGGALAVNTGNQNTATGYGALNANTTSDYNTAIGSQSLGFNTTGSNNTASGTASLHSNTTGSNNTATGYQSFYYNTTGSNNTGIGISAGISITTGSKNTLLGSYTGNQNGLDIRTSNNNVVLSDGDGNIRFYANSSGNVGLGTTNPTEKLTVVGVTSSSSFYGDASYTVSGRWTVSNNSNSDYTFTGIGFTQTTNDPVLYLARGRVYEFVNNSVGSHPFEIRVSNGGAAYNDGVTNNAAASGVIRFEIPFNAPNTLYYQCTSHSGMGNTISVYPNTI